MSRASILILSLLLISHLSSAKILLIGKNTSLSFDDIESNFSKFLLLFYSIPLLSVFDSMHHCNRNFKSLRSCNGTKLWNLRWSYMLKVRNFVAFSKLLFVLNFSKLELRNWVFISLCNWVWWFGDWFLFTAPMIKRSDQGGVLYIAEPLDACSDLVNSVNVQNGTTVSPPYVLIIRGGCSFEDKIRNAQKAGYKAAIVYDYEDYGFLVSSKHISPLAFFSL